MLAIQEDACDLRTLGTSPVFAKDYFVNCVADFCPPSFYEEEIAAQVNVQCVAEFDDRDILHSESTYTTTSCGTSVTSDLSEDSYFDNDDEFDPFTESDDTFLLEISLDFKSNMSSDDQMQTVEYLTRIVSSTLGLREQLDIIRIISPDATISSTDTEFFIDLDAFNDDKFQRLKLYISEHVLSSDCKKCLESRQKRGQSKMSPSSHPKYSKRKAAKPLTTKPVSKKSRKSKGLLSRIHRQMEKEKRSGLFSKEEVRKEILWF
ncbi:hypothetical protein QZH41_015881 [Actinostola sp. cb2023]|nr:hypothetical protein QZH41_015881 [Actinostola sp. cb2023]